MPARSKKTTAPKETAAAQRPLARYESVAALALHYDGFDADVRAFILDQVRTYIRAEGLLPDSEGNYLEAIDAIARRIDGPGVDAADKALSGAGDLAGSGYAWNARAALAFGLTLGVALAHSGEGAV